MGSDRPGENLPIQHDDYTSDAHGLRDLLQVMESKIESGFQELNGRLGSLEARMSAIEKTQADFRSASSSSSPSSGSLSEGMRKRRSPSHLQVRIFFSFNFWFCTFMGP